MLGVTLDTKLNFATYLLNIKKKPNKKFNALMRVQKCITTDQKQFVFSSFIKSQFTYCPFIRIFCTKYSFCRINNTHEWYLRLIQQNYISEFERLLENVNEKSIHQKYIEFLLIELYKYLDDLLLSTLSLSSDKVPITSEISTHLNLKMLEQKSLAQTVLHTELVSFGKMFPKR